MKGWKRDSRVVTLWKPYISVWRRYISTVKEYKIMHRSKTYICEWLAEMQHWNIAKWFAYIDILMLEHVVIIKRWIKFHGNILEHFAIRQQKCITKDRNTRNFFFNLTLFPCILLYAVNLWNKFRDAYASIRRHRRHQRIFTFMKLRTVRQFRDILKSQPPQGKTRNSAFNSRTGGNPASEQQACLCTMHH